jgi:hypothetical protein
LPVHLLFAAAIGLGMRGRGYAYNRGKENCTSGEQMLLHCPAV